MGFDAKKMREAFERNKVQVLRSTETIKEEGPFLKEEPSGPPLLGNEPVNQKLTNRMARLLAAGVSKSSSATALLRWKSQLEDLISNIQKEGELLVRENPDISVDDYQSWIDEETELIRKALDTPLPLNKTSGALAIWLADRFGLETYENESFYSRHYASERWKRHLFGTSKGLELYSSGYLYEVVPLEVLERALQKQSDLSPNFRTQSGDEIGIIGPSRRAEIIKELITRMRPVGNHIQPKFGKDQPAGIATTEATPKWITIGKAEDENGYQIEGSKYELKIEEVAAEHAARFAVACKWNPEAECPIFDKFLSDSFGGSDDKEEIIECLYRWLAAAVLGITYKYKRSLYCFGPTDSGKSVLLDVISSLFPADAQTSLTFEMLNDRFSSARLVNSRLNVVREVKKANLKSGGFDSETYKTAVSGEPLEAEIKHGAHFTFSPRVAFISAANGAIPLTNEGAAVYNRISVIHFRNQVAKEDQDIYLIEKLKAETSGILNKIMEAGVRLLNENILLDPPSSQELKKKWSSQLSSTLAWLNQVANPIHKRIPHGKAKEHTTPTAAIYKNYKNWCVVEGVKAKGKVAFWTELEALGATRKKTKSGDRANITLRKSPQLF